MDKKDLNEIEVNYPEIFEHIKKLEKENIKLLGCLRDLDLISLNYDGYRTIEGISKLFERLRKIIISKNYEGLFDYKNREICPLCRKLKNTEKDKYNPTPGF